MFMMYRNSLSMVRMFAELNSIFILITLYLFGPFGGYEQWDDIPMQRLTLLMFSGLHKL
jgi:hypothetical protein